MKVELISRTEGVGKYKDLSIEEITSAIARHGVVKEDGFKLIKYLVSKQHWSPLDMVNFGFEIETSRAIGRQLLRHWTIKPQEHSQRYSDRVQFEDIELRREHPTNRQSSTEVLATVHNNLECGHPLAVHTRLEAIPQSYLARIENLLVDIQNLYKEGLEFGIAKECLRNMLPECTTTTMTLNGSLRSWLTFLNVRCDIHTQKEARDIATLIGASLEKEMPNMFSIIDWKQGMFI